MKKTKAFEKISLLRIGTTALTLGSNVPSYAQIKQGNTIISTNTSLIYSKNLVLDNLMFSNVDSSIRKGPSSSEQVIDLLKKGSQVEIIYHTSRGWSRIKYNNFYGYVESKYLSSIKSLEDEKCITMYCNIDKLNIRKGPSTKYSVIGNLNLKDKIDVISHLDNNWSKIKFNGEYAYVSTLHLSELS